MKLSNLAKVLRAAGLTVVESPGWATRGYDGQDLAEVRGILWHHTATGRGAYAKSNAPTLQMTINGRSDLAGPLCNITFGRDGTVYLVAAGVANHAGAGSAPNIPTDMGNHYLIGIEMESSGIAPWDWTEDQIRVAPHLGAALERAYLQGIPEALRLQIGHKEYSSQGKIDPAGWPGDMDGLRASINAVLNGSAAIAPQSTTIKKGPSMANPTNPHQDLTDAVWDVNTTKFDEDGETAAGTMKTKTILGNIPQWFNRTIRGIGELKTSVDALTAAVQASNKAAGK